MKKKHKKARRMLLLLLCYLGALLLWLGLCAFHLARDSWYQSRGQMPHQTLQPQDFTTASGVHFSEDWQANSYFATADSDPQLILEFDQPQPVGLFIFDAQAVNKPPGEIVLYYTTRPGQPFSDRHKLWARQGDTNQWYFDLGGRKVTALRLDPDAVGGVFWQVQSMDLNMPKRTSFYFRPDGLESCILLFAPILAWAILGEAFAFFQPVYARKKMDNRWNKTGKQKPASP